MPTLYLSFVTLVFCYQFLNSTPPPPPPPPHVHLKFVDLLLVLGEIYFDFLIFKLTSLLKWGVAVCLYQLDIHYFTPSPVFRVRQLHTCSSKSISPIFTLHQVCLITSLFFVFLVTGIFYFVDCF